MHFIIHGNILIGTRISLVKVQSNQNKSCISTSLWYILQDLTSSCRGSPDRMNVLGMNYIPGTFIGIQNLANQILRWPHTNYCFQCTVYHKGANLKTYLFQLDWWKYFSVFQQACSVWKFTNSICIRELKFRSIYI